MYVLLYFRSTGLFTSGVCAFEIWIMWKSIRAETTRIRYIHFVTWLFMVEMFYDTITGHRMSTFTYEIGHKFQCKFKLAWIWILNLQSIGNIFLERPTETSNLTVTRAKWFEFCCIDKLFPWILLIINVLHRAARWNHVQAFEDHPWDEFERESFLPWICFIWIQEVSNVFLQRPGVQRHHSVLLFLQSHRHHREDVSSFKWHQATEYLFVHHVHTVSLFIFAGQILFAGYLCVVSTYCHEKKRCSVMRSSKWNWSERCQRCQCDWCIRPDGNRLDDWRRWWWHLHLHIRILMSLGHFFTSLPIRRQFTCRWHHKVRRSRWSHLTKRSTDRQRVSSVTRISRNSVNMLLCYTVSCYFALMFLFLRNKCHPRRCFECSFHLQVNTCHCLSCPSCT